MALKLNEEAFQYAKKLIEAGKVDVTSSWSKASQPTVEDGTKFIEKNGWKPYGKWFLGINTDKPKNEKQDFEFPYGDYTNVYREAVIAAKQRAGQYKHTDIEKAASQLLQLIDEENN